MSRLKGGKVLIDLSNYNWIDTEPFSITKELLNAILTKGIECLVSFSGNKILTIPYEVHISTANSTITYTLFDDPDTTDIYELIVYFGSEPYMQGKIE